jgi:hypothetical protein
MKISKFKILAGAIFGVIIFMTILTLLFKGPRMRVQPSVRAFETAAANPPEDAVPFDTIAFDASGFSLPQPSEDNIARGRVYYNYYCVFCHGENGDGEGEVGKSYVPRPANLSSDSIQNLSVHELYIRSFTGTGHSPVLERVVPNAHGPYVLLYITEEF